MKLLFIGTGSIGERHIKIIQNEYNYPIYALRSGHSVKILHGVVDIYTWEDVDFIRPEVAFICNPSGLHIQTAIQCAQRGMKLFIEKPLDLKPNGLGKLKRIVREKNIVSYVAYPFRHHPEVLKIKNVNSKATVEMICRTDTRKWPSKRPIDDIRFELSHEWDLAKWLFPQNEVRFNLHDGSATEKRKIIYGGQKFDLLDKKDMYERQIRYFFDNIDNVAMMNNLFEASEVFLSLIESVKK